LQAFHLGPNVFGAENVALKTALEDNVATILRFVLSRTRAIVDAGTKSGVFSFLAARYCKKGSRIIAYNCDARSLALLNETIWLNNWEDRFLVLNPESPPQGNDLAKLVKRADVPKISLLCFDNQSAFRNGFLLTLEEMISRDHPLVLIGNDDSPEVGKGANNEYEGAIQSLRRHNYSIWILNKSGRFFRIAKGETRGDFVLVLCKHKLSFTGLPSRFRLWKIWFQAKDRMMRRIGSAARKVLQAIQNPTVATRWIVGQINQTISYFKRVCKKCFQNKYTSYREHNAQMLGQDAIERHIRLFTEFERENHFNSSEMRLGDFLARYPSVRSKAIDVGSGAGWLSARLCKEGFREVVGIEPSAAALAIAAKVFPKDQYPNVTWINGFAEDVLPTLKLEEPSLFVTGCVLAHLTDSAVERICNAICRTAAAGSLLGFSEPWGIDSHEFMWHVRTQEWWSKKLAGWNLDFYGPEIENIPGRHKGFHGVKVS
jgi:SAM-dependent methyltransferase